LEGEVAKTYPMTQINDPAEGIVALDEVVERMTCSSYPGEVLGLNILEDVVKDLGRKMG
jgi:hypothetical protein